MCGFGIWCVENDGNLDEPAYAGFFVFRGAGWFLEILAIFSGICCVGEEAVDDGEDEAEGKSPPEAVDLEAGYEEIYKLDDEGVDNEQEETEGYNGYGDCENDQDGFYNGICNCEHQRNQQGIAVVVYVHAGKDVRGDEDGEGIKE